MSEQYVIFKLGQEEYGINIMNVTEISPYEEITKIPSVPDFIEGVINYRGTVIPIISIKKRFGISLDEVDHNTRIIIINLNDKQIGFIVDEASETIKLEDGDIDLSPNISSNIDMKYINGVGKLDKRLIILIDLVKIMTDDEVEEFSEIA